MFTWKKKLDLQPFSFEITTKESSSFSYKGLLLAMISGIFYTATAIIFKNMKNLHPGQLSVYRFIGIFVFSFPEAVKCQENLMGPSDMRFFIMLGGLFGATNLFLNFIAFRYLPLGESAAIIFSVPIFVTAAARVLLKEPCGIFQTFTVFTTVVGIVFTTKLPLRLSGNAVYTKDSICGLLAAIGSLLFSTCRFIVIRKVKSVHHSIVMFNFGWVAIIETVILTAIVGRFEWHDCGLQSLLIVVLGLLSYAGQTLLTVSLQCELAGPVSTVRAAASVTMAFALQTLLFGEAPDFCSSVGAILVGLSIFFVCLKKWVSAQPAASKRRQKLGWMLK